MAMQALAERADVRPAFSQRASSSRVDNGVFDGRSSSLMR